MTTAISWAGDVPLAHVIPDPRQPRKYFDESALAQLAASVKAQGIIEPLIVRPLAEKDPNDHRANGAKYVLVAGERRFRAAERAGLATVPVVVRAYDSQQAHVAQLGENMDREALRPLEVADAYARWLEATKGSQQQLAQILGKTEAHVSQVLALRRLPKKAAAFIAEHNVDFSVARELVRLAPFPDRLDAVLESVADGGLSRRDVAREVKWELEAQAARDRELKAREKAKADAAAKRRKTKTDKRAQAQAKRERALEAKRQAKEQLDAARERSIAAALPQVIADAAPAFAKQVLKIRAKCKLPDDVLAAVLERYGPGDAWAPKMTRHSELLVKAIAPKLPGKWRKITSLYGRPPVDNGAGGLSWLALAAWLQLETAKLDAALEKAAAALAHDKALGQVAV